MGSEGPERQSPVLLKLQINLPGVGANQPATRMTNQQTKRKEKYHPLPVQNATRPSMSRWMKGCAPTNRPISKHTSQRQP
jgi:hypothetical protein